MLRFRSRGPFFARILVLPYVVHFAEGGPIYLAIGQQGNGIDLCNQRWQHIIGQAVFKGLPKLADSIGRLAVR